MAAFVCWSFWEGCCPSVPVPLGTAMTILTLKRRFSLIFALYNISPSSSRSPSGGTASPHCAAPCRRMDGQTDSAAGTGSHAAGAPAPGAGTAALSLKPRSLDAYIPVDKTFQSSPSASPELSIGRRACRATHPTLGTSTRADTQSPLT